LELFSFSAVDVSSSLEWESSPKRGRNCEFSSFSSSSSSELKPLSSSKRSTFLISASISSKSTSSSASSTCVSDVLVVFSWFVHVCVDSLSVFIIFSLFVCCFN